MTPQSALRVAVLVKFIVVITLSVSGSTADDTLLDCRQGWLTHSNACYKFIENINAWGKAEQLCSNRQASLLTIENYEEHQWIASQIEKYSRVDSWWIGLKGLDNSSFQWARSTIQTEYTVPFAQEPNNANGKEDCAMISSRGFFRDENCSRVNRFICMANRSSSDTECEAENKYYGAILKSPEYCYYFNVFGWKNWNEAKNRCRSLRLNGSGVKGDLLSLKTQDQRDKVLKHIDIIKVFGGAWWTGLRYQDVDKKYEFSDGTPYSKTLVPWLTKEAILGTNDDCGALITSGNLTAYECSINLAYICKHSRVRRLEQRCPDYWTRVGNSCYFSDPEDRVNWTSAHSYCESKGAHLLQIDSLEEKRWLEKALALQFDRLWTGLRAKEQDDTFVWEDGTKPSKSLITWDQTALKDKHCSILDITIGKRDYKRCEEDVNALTCEYKKNNRQAACLQGWNSYEQKCYRFSTESENLDWHETKSACEKLLINQTLDFQPDVNYITIENADELEFVIKTAISSNIRIIWLGLNDLDKENVWVWAGSPNVPPSTVPLETSFEEPNTKNKCVQIGYGGLIKTRPCRQHYPFMCEMELKTIPGGSSSQVPMLASILALLAVSAHHTSTLIASW